METERNDVLAEVTGSALDRDAEHYLAQSGKWAQILSLTAMPIGLLATVMLLLYKKDITFVLAMKTDGRLFGIRMQAETEFWLLTLLIVFLFGVFLFPLFYSARLKKAMRYNDPAEMAGAFGMLRIYFTLLVVTGLLSLGYTVWQKFMAV